MFGIGLPEFILIMALALIVVGPDKLPGLAKTVAKQILELKKAANSLKDSLQEELAEEKQSLKELSHGLEDIDVSLDHLASAKGAEVAESASSAPVAGGNDGGDVADAAAAGAELPAEQAEAKEATPQP